MKKALALVSALLLALFMFTGCSSDEVGFYKTVKSLSSLKNYTYSGSVGLKINKLEVGGDSASEYVNAIAAMLEDAKLSYKGNVNMSGKKITFLLTIASDYETEHFNLILDHGMLEVSPELQSFIPSDFSGTKITIDKSTYYRYDIAAMIDTINQMKETKITNPYDQSKEKASFDGYNDAMNGKDDNSDYSSDDDTQEAYEEGYEQYFIDSEENSSIETYKEMVPSLQGMLTVFDPTDAQKTLQQKLSSLADNLIGTYFKGLKFGLVKKSGDSTYTCNATLSDLTTALQKLTAYIEQNPDALKSMLLSTASGLTDAEVKAMNLGDSLDTRSELVAYLNQIDFSKLSQVLASKASGETSDMKMECSLRKTGIETYATGATLYLKASESGDDGYNIDATVTQKLTVAGESGVGSSVEDLNDTSSAPSITLKVTNSDVRETGILVSTHSNMSSPTKLKAVSSGDSYTVDLSGLDLQSNSYYYEVYTVDSAGNTLVSTEIATMGVPLANPDTGAGTNLPAVLAVFAISAAGLSILCRRRKC